MIKATYKNDLNEYKKFMFYTVFVVNNKKIIVITFEILAIISFILSLCLFNALWLIIGGLFAVFGGLLFLMNYVIVNTKTEKMVKGFKDFYKIKNEYTFYKDRVDLITFVGKNQKPGSIKYDDFYMVAETKDFFYLYASKTVGIIVKKSSVEDVNSLKEIFKKVFDKKHCKLKK